MPEFDQNRERVLMAEEMPAGLPWRLFLFVLLLFALAVLSYAGLVFGYRPYLESKVSVVDTSLQSLKESVPAEEQKSFLRFYSQVVNLKSLLDKHVSLGKLFDFIERNTNRRVNYEAISVNADRKELVLEGVAASYATLSEELEALNRAKEVAHYMLNQSQLAESKVRFRIVVNLNPAIFKL